MGALVPILEKMKAPQKDMSCSPERQPKLDVVSRWKQRTLTLGLLHPGYLNVKIFRSIYLIFEPLTINWIKYVNSLSWSNLLIFYLYKCEFYFYFEDRLLMDETHRHTTHPLHSHSVRSLPAMGWGCSPEVCQIAARRRRGWTCRGRLRNLSLEFLLLHRKFI